MIWDIFLLFILPNIFHMKDKLLRVIHLWRPQNVAKFVTHHPSPHPQKWTIDLLFKKNRGSLWQISKPPKTHCVKNFRIRSYSGPYFPAFGLNTETYSVFLRIQSECGKIRTRITQNTTTFYAVNSVSTERIKNGRSLFNIVMLFLLMNLSKQEFLKIASYFLYFQDT